MQEEENSSFIRLEHISKIYETKEKRVEAVKNVNLQIDKGKIVGIIGFSGAGKSTLVRCINLLERLSEGRVIVNGKDLTAMKPDELRHERKKIGMIFQHFNLFASRTVYQNVAFPLKHSGMKKEEINKKVTHLLELVGLSDKGNVYPSQLSGGQKQRVAIARALANDPEVLLSDEATSALDPETTKSILQLLKKLNEELGITIVVITHEMQVVKEICHEALVMEGGNAVEFGNVFDIFSNPKSKITKRFVESTTTLSQIYGLLEQDSVIGALKKGQCIVRFTYLERTSAEALVSMLSRDYNIDINIIFGDIELIGTHPIGGLVSIISGEKENIIKAIAYLKQINVGVEVIRDAGVFE